MDNGFAQWGGYMEAKTSKLRQQYNDVKNIYAQNNLFDGISIYVNGHTNPSADELKRLIMLNGGIYHHYESSDTTYIIASNLPDVKVRNMKLDRTISAQWIVDCIKEKRLLDYTYYLLYTNRKATQPQLQWGRQNHKKIKLNDDCSDCIERFGDGKNHKSTLTPAKQIIPKDVKPLAEAKSATTTSPKNAMQEDENSLKDALNVLHNQLKQSGLVKNCKKEDQVKCKAQRNVQANPKVTPRHATTTAEGDFLDEFQNNSRLHQISTLASRLKQHINTLRSEQNCTDKSIKPESLQQLIDKLQNNNRRNTNEIDQTKSYIMHIDMDCFFVSVGLRKHPHLKHLPTVVTHRTVVGPNSEMSMAEVACASYESRKFGISNGMLMGEAWTLCPSLKVMPYDFEGYVEVAFTLYNTIAQYTLDIEAVSCDELYVNITDILKIGKITPTEFMTAVRDEVFDKTNCSCSAGVGHNKLQARLATKKAKPNGQCYLDDDNVMKFLSTLPIKDLPGIGYVTSATLKNAGLNVCGDIINNQLSEKDLQQLIGTSNGKMLYNYCHGIDHRQLEYEHIPNSVSVEMNYGIRYDTVKQVENALYSLSAKVHEKLLNIKRKAKCLILKIMLRAKIAPVEAPKYMGHGMCDTKRKSSTLLQYTDNLETIFNNFKKLMQQLNIEPCELRGLGVQLSKLSPAAAAAAATTTATVTTEITSATTTKGVSTNKQIHNNTIVNMFQKMKEKEKEVEKTKKIENVGRDNEANTDAIASVKEKHSDNKRKTIVNANNNNRKKSSQNKYKTIDKIFQKQLQNDSNTNCQRSLSSSSTIVTATTTITTTTKDSQMISATFSDFSASSDLNVPFEDIEKEFRTKNLENLFLKANCQQSLLNWFKQQHHEEPSQYDIDLLCYMAKDLIRNYDMDLDKLYDALIYLVNLLNSYDTSSPTSSIKSSVNCSWHLMFKHLLQIVNIEIMTKFNGRSLHMIEQLICTKCTNIQQ